MKMETTSIPKLLWKLSSPVMLALLIQSIYNIVDSFFVAQVSTTHAVAKQRLLYGYFQKKICGEIYRNGLGSIVTQSLYTLYIVGLNLILKGFTEGAVTVLGIYYKIQSFFFIPLLGFQQVLLPLISYN